MLVLIAGITGGLGTLLAGAALRRGFRVRGLGRNPDNLDPAIASQLESFIKSSSYDDVPALDKAVTSVDAVICAYKAQSILTLEGCLLLLRAAERAGVKIFHASSWNADWRDYAYGEFEHYDAHIAFQRHVELTSSIKPVYVFTGIFGDFLFHPWGPALLSKTESGAARVRVWGKGDATWTWTSMQDAAEFSIDVLTRPDVQEGKGGYFSVKSADNSILDIAKAYENVRGVHVDVEYVGDVDELGREVAQARQELGPGGYYQNLVLLSRWFGYLGKMRLRDAETVINGKPTTNLEELLRNKPDI